LGSVADPFRGSLDSYEYSTSSNEVPAGEEGNTEDRKNNAKDIIGIANVRMVAIKEFC